MRILVVDSSTERQADTATRLRDLDQSDIEALDLRLKLASPEEYIESVPGADVLIVGPSLAESAMAITRSARSVSPNVQVIIFLSKEDYSGGAFRAAYSAGARKVMPASSTNLDLLQELVAINAEFKREGRTREGKVTAVVHVKGGVGATSLVAALGELSSSRGKRTLLWDLDIDSRDLSRALTAAGPQSKVIASWVSGKEDINRETLASALFPLSENANLLMPPDDFAEAMDMGCHTDMVQLVTRVLYLVRATYDNIIIDTAGRLGPASGAAIRGADSVVVVLDDTSLGLSAADILLANLRKLIGGMDRIKIVCAGADRPIAKVNAEIEPLHKLGAAAWDMPVMPYDPAAAEWAGRGKTIYTLGQRETRLVIEQIAIKIGLISQDTPERPIFNAPAMGTAKRATTKISIPGMSALIPTFVSKGSA